MPIARIQMPDGRIARIEVPEGTTPEQAESLAMSVVPSTSAKPATTSKPAAAPKPAPRAYNIPDPGEALSIYNRARDSLTRMMAGKSEAERSRAMSRFESDPRIQGVRRSAGLVEVRSRQDELRNVARQQFYRNRENRKNSPIPQLPGSDFLDSFRSSVANTFGIGDRIAALPASMISGRSYNDELEILREQGRLEREQSTAGNIAGMLYGGAGAAKGVGGTVNALARSGSAPVARVGNVLQGLSQVQKGQGVRNVGRVVLAGAAGGGAQALGEGSDVTEGVIYGAAAPVVLGAGVKGAGLLAKGARAISRPFSSNVSKALREVVQENPDRIAARLQGLKNQTGSEVPVIAALNDRDFADVAKNVVQKSPEAAEAAKKETGQYIRSFMDRMLRHVNKAGREADNGGAQITSIGDLAELRKNTADDLMQPIGDRSIDLTQLSLDDLERQMTREIGGRIRDLAPRINEALKDLAPDDLKAMGLDASDLSKARKLMTDFGLGKPVPVTVREMDALRRTLDAAGKSSANGNPANSMAYRNAAKSIREFVEKEVPEYGQMVDTYAAQSRIMEGFETAASGKRIGDIADDLLRNNLKTPEGRIGLQAGELYRQRQAVSSRPTSAISTARDLAARGKLTRPAGMDPEAALPGSVTENLGDTAAANLANAAEGETRVLDRMLDSDKLNAMAQNEMGSISPEQIAYGALLGNAMAATKARFVLSILDKLPNGINPKVAENISEMLYSQDPAQVQKAMNALSKVGLTERVVTRMMQESVPISAAVGASVGSPDKPQTLPNVEGSLDMGDPALVEDGAEIPAADEENTYDESAPFGRQVVEALFPGVVVTDDIRDPNSDLGRANPDSYHIRTDGAVDVRPIPGMTFDEFIATLEDNDYEIIQAIDETQNPSGHATGPHWHVVIG